jgi:hypothetical protein
LGPIATQPPRLRDLPDGCMPIPPDVFLFKIEKGGPVCRQQIEITGCDCDPPAFPTAT